MIRVFVRGRSAVELAGLEALVKSASFLELAGSSLGRAQTAMPATAIDADVILERPPLDEGGDSQIPDPDEGPQARVWIVGEGESQIGLAAVREGAVRGLLPPWSEAKEIFSAIEAAAAGLVVLHPDIAEQANLTSSSSGAAGDGSAATPGQQVSPRESEIMNLLAAGLGNKQIAARLDISEHTVKFHITSIFNKLGASSRAEAVAIGIRRGLIIL